MDRIDDAIRIVQNMDDPDRKSSYAAVHPLAMLVTALAYIILLTSVNKYRLGTVLAMGVWLYGYAVFARLSAKECFRKLWGLFLLLFLVGIANPILDRQVIATVGRIPITTGMVSMLTLFLKGTMALVSAYFLAKSCGMFGILSALRALHVPNVLISVVYLIYRYLTLLLEEARRVWTAYRLRAPGQKGIHISVWGSLVGSLLIRSMDRAETVYQSMELRGYRPELAFADRMKWTRKSTAYLILCLGTMAVLRFVPVLSLIGSFWIR